MLKKYKYTEEIETEIILFVIGAIVDDTAIVLLFIPTVQVPE